MKAMQFWLVLTNGEDIRVVKRRPVLAANEVAIEVKVKVPQPPRIIGTIDIKLPEPPAAIVNSAVIEYPDEPTDVPAAS